MSFGGPLVESETNRHPVFGGEIYSVVYRFIVPNVFESGTLMTVIHEAALFYRPESAALRFLPEGPYPLASGRCSWVAIQHGADQRVGSLNLLDLEQGANTTYPLPGRPGFAFPCVDGTRFVVGCERELGIFDTQSNAWQSIASGIDADVEGTIVNDGLIWEDNLVFGTKDLEFKTQKAGLYLFRGSDQKLIRLRSDQVCSNGKAIRSTPSGLELVDLDSPTRKVVGYTIDRAGGTLAQPRTLRDLTNDASVPDGAILTPDGKSIIISMYNPNPAPFGETRQYSLESGELQVVWRTPGSPQNTCPNLVERGGKIWLLITTAVEHMPVDRQSDAPHAGCLFISETEFSSVGAAPKFKV